MANWYCTLCDTNSDTPEKPGTCPSCGADEIMMIDPDQGIPATPEDVRDVARKRLKGICAAYPACDGNFDKICQKEAYGKPIGFGGAGQGAGFRANALALSAVRFKTRVVGEHVEPDTRVNFLGIDLEFPVMAASTAGIERYNNVVKETDFCRAVVRGSKQAGTIGWRGDTWFYTPDNSPALQALEQEKGYGIPIFKPRSQDVLKRLITMAEEAGCPAVGIDLDGCGSTIMAKHGQPVFRKSVAEIRELVEFSSLPFIAKGIMDPDDAEECAEAGVKVVAVSNHGGRVLDSVPGTAEVLPLIAQRLNKRVLITADGGVRTGYDVLKMLALGADAVLLGRDIIRAAVGGGSLGVRLHLAHIHKVLKKALFMTGLKSIREADGKILFP